jgi:hydroxypyruvate isomerase
MDFYHTQMVEGDIAAKFERWLRHIGRLPSAASIDLTGLSA